MVQARAQGFHKERDVFILMKTQRTGSDVLVYTSWRIKCCHERILPKCKMMQREVSSSYPMAGQVSLVVQMLILLINAC